MLNLYFDDINYWNYIFKVILLFFLCTHKNLDKHKVTVAQYKTLVRSSLQRILNCLKTFSQLIIQSKENLMNEMQENFNKKIQIFIISKKTGEICVCFA